MHLSPYFKNVLLVLSCVANQIYYLASPCHLKKVLLTLKISILGNVSMCSIADAFADQNAVIFILTSFEQG